MAPVSTIPGFYPQLRGAPPSPSTALQLFAGTFCIFVVTVLFWKAGKFLRRFTKDKVIGEGNSPTSRYAKTWYGWVPRQETKSNHKKSITQGWLARIQKWTTWDSAKNQYSAVWWTSSEKVEACKQPSRNRQRLQLPLLNPNASMVDSIHSPYGYAPGIGRGAGSYSSPKMTGVLDADDMVNVRTGKLHPPKRRYRRNFSARELFKSELQSISSASPEKKSTMILNYCTVKGQNPPAHSLTRRRFLSLNQSACLIRGNDLIFCFSKGVSSIKRNFSLPCLSDLRITFRNVQKGSDTSWHTLSLTDHFRQSRTLQALRYSRKYQIWSARMALNNPQRGRYNTHQLLVPPGSPPSELLTSFSSHQSTLARMINGGRNTTVCSSLSGFGSLSISSLKGRRVRRASLIGYQARDTITEEWQQTATLGVQDQWQIETTHSVAMHQYHVQFKKRQCPSSRAQEPIQPRDGHRHRSSQEQKNINKLRKRPTQIIVPLKNLSKWEILLIDGLDRRLRWLSQQLIPGRRPFHFPLLPSHWLNIRTWIIYDPASRAPIDAKRRLGDPRFNKPYPAPKPGPRRKYPEAAHKLACNSRIDSWRTAVNRNRKASGVGDFVKPTELYDGSAEDPQDGKIDPACWILRKPPQGSVPSARQNEAYYEGGAGWQERLGDWQNVRRGYRIRKAIYEGQANRTRAKEVAIGVTRYYRMARYRRQNLKS
ncbi:hypothetical protein BDV23DRAFT_19759 [Aspergillus alliaceus]|uniref:Uncharacterized protein n=2 Tax=Petromyces alliaceus TaxID=209559 RepID=A0A5N7BTZ8_PETAA|nr:hypothetical protein BDV23DRAFT_19759 [Aspergillus alliaceus]